VTQLRCDFRGCLETHRLGGRGVTAVLSLSLSCHPLPLNPVNRDDQRCVLLQQGAFPTVACMLRAHISQTRLGHHPLRPRLDGRQRLGGSPPRHGLQSCPYGLEPNFRLVQAGASVPPIGSQVNVLASIKGAEQAPRRLSPLSAIKRLGSGEIPEEMT